MSEKYISLIKTENEPLKWDVMKGHPSAAKADHLCKEKSIEECNDQRNHRWKKSTKQTALWPEWVDEWQIGRNTIY